MSSKFNLPQFKAINYRFNPETGYFTKTEKQALESSLMRLPYQVKIARTQADKIKCNAQRVIFSREMNKSGTYKFFTGLQETNLPEWYIGNDYEYVNGKKVTSLILFNLTEGNSQLTIFYFKRFDKRTHRDRVEFAHGIIPIISESFESV